MIERVRCIRRNARSPDDCPYQPGGVDLESILLLIEVVTSGCDKLGMESEHSAIFRR
ncbi:hypothetical protein HQ587_07130 [bacterium]|nr:hypothetical protein [bacterium]